MLRTELARKRMGTNNGGKGGFVVNIASICGVVPEPTITFYGAAKAAVVHYSRIVGVRAYNEYSEEFLRLVLSNDISKLEPKEIGESVIKLINDNKPGGVAIVDKDGGFFYVPPSFDTNFSISKLEQRN
ncbi:hypothetical protein Anas_06030 [Armadillidium nasatum]|uniref:15-hydroxyprostaglandin dehydrogenase [NAD(+)] n=1 Tax=Armadillidium nasatum TaxID=96803 RepID=A0A5N5TH45_9CRUS|nr:hypothetical protein Anas_06030 [Armadillidium nasatum]